jgi:uncharacterized protein YjbI with pentapeptide repeats
MSPQVVAAIIAASVSFITLIGTVAVQYFGRRATSKDTRKALEEQGKQLDRTLAEQRTRTLNERFATAAEQLGSDKPAVRLAGAYSMAGLADDWEENRQTCVDVLCGYLRMPYEPDPGEEAAEPERLAFRASREVRHTVIRVIGAHLKDGAAVSWRGLDFDFTGVVFDGGDFSGAVFSGGQISFSSAVFSGGRVSFRGAMFSGGKVGFDWAELSGGQVGFTGSVYSGGEVSFSHAKFSGAEVDFGIEIGSVIFIDGRFYPGCAVFSRGQVNFYSAEFSSGKVGFNGAKFIGSQVSFSGAKFTGSQVSFGAAVFSGGQVDFSKTTDWAHRPEFDFDGAPPDGVKLPAQLDAPTPESTSAEADGSPPAGP